MKKDKQPEQQTEIIGTDVVLPEEKMLPEKKEDEIQKKIDEMATVPALIQTGLQSFREREEELKSLRKEADGLEIKTIDDKEAIKQVSTIRIKLKNARVKITKEAKSLRDPLTNFNRFISTKEGELLAIITPTEEALQKKEDWVEEEREKLRLKAIKEEEDTLQARVNELDKYDREFELVYLKGLTDDQFAVLVERARKEWEKDEEDRKEQERLQQLKEEQDRKDKAELEKLRKEKEEFLKQRTDMRKAQLSALGFVYDSTESDFVHEVDADVYIDMKTVQEIDSAFFNQKMEEFKSAIDAYNKAKEEREAKEKLEKEQREANEKMATIRKNQLRDLGMVFNWEENRYEFLDVNVNLVRINNLHEEDWDKLLAAVKIDVEDKKKKAEDLRKQREAKIAHDAAVNALREKKEKEEREKLERAERLAQASDLVKLQTIIDYLTATPFPEMTSKKAKQQVANIKAMLKGVVDGIESSIANKPADKAA